MVKSLLKLSRPIHLLMSALTYTLGAGIAHYLGQYVHPASFGLGLLAVMILQGAAYLFAEYFNLPLTPLMEGETHQQRELFRVKLLQVSYAAMTTSVVAIMTMSFSGLLNLPAGIMIGLAFLFLLVYAIPPLRLSEKGYGELILALVLGTILPWVGFLLQYGDLHRLMAITTFPITLLALSFLLVCNFPTFASDQKLGRHTLLTRLTWQNAVPIHHFLVLVAYLIITASPLLGIPWHLVWPSLLALPFAAIQIFWLQRISKGGRTLWNFLTALASATFGLTTYLLALTFWLR
jgi:1,4-dihydroxy-2-naphthoate octaprenyltransferase